MTSQEIPVEHIKPCKLNPRKRFDPIKLYELGVSIRENGQINDALVRPCEPCAEYPKAKYESVAGERRWRAHQPLVHPVTGDVLPALRTIRAKIQELSDRLVLDLMLSENMQRHDLSELEESDAFWAALSQKDDQGNPVYTVDTLGKKLGVSYAYVHSRLGIRKLPSEGREALETGTLSFRTVRALCVVPESVLPRVLEVVLRPKKHQRYRWRESNDPLTEEETRDLISTEFVRELRGAPFQLNNAVLLPIRVNEQHERIEGGACTDCPWNTANQREPVEPGEKRGRGRPAGSGKFCLNPECYRRKVEIHTSAELVKAKEEGCKILTPGEARKVIHETGELHHGSSFVRLEDKPDIDDRAKGVAEKKCPTWGKIVTGEVQAPVVVAVDDKGRVHRLVERKLAIEAAQKNGNTEYLNLSSGRARSVQQDEVAEQKRKERERQKLDRAVSLAMTASVIEAVEGRIEPKLWRWIAKAALLLGGMDAAQWIAKRRSLEFDDDARTAVEKYAKSLQGNEAAERGLAIELLMARQLKYSASGCEELRKLCTMYGVEIGAIEKSVRDELAPKKTAKQNREAATDQLLDKAKALLESDGGALTIAVLQRKLKIGYVRASAIFEQLGLTAQVEAK